MSRHSNMWIQGRVLRRRRQHLLVCANGACQRLLLLGQALVRRTGYVETIGELRRRCIQTFGSGGACESAQKPAAAQIEKSEHDQEERHKCQKAEPISSQTRWAARISELGVGRAASAVDLLQIAYVFRDEAVLTYAAARHQCV